MKSASFHDNSGQHTLSDSDNLLVSVAALTVPYTDRYTPSLESSGAMLESYRQLLGLSSS